jgi:hypothetical protein
MQSEGGAVGNVGGRATACAGRIGLPLPRVSAAQSRTAAASTTVVSRRGSSTGRAGPKWRTRYSPGAILLEHSDEWATQRSRHMILRVISGVSDIGTVRLSAVRA